MSYKKTALIIMDGWGLGEESNKNAIYLANTPFFDKIIKEYPHTFLKASGEAVGLPEGQMGNSEIGHTTIGAGSAIDTDLVVIEKSIRDNSFFKNESFLRLINHVKKNDNACIHIIGLLSDGGVHSHNSHIYAFLKMAKENGIYGDRVVLHVFTDGRDVSGGTAKKYIKELEDKMDELGVGIIGSFGGRYYGMDRAGNDDRIKHVTDILFNGDGNELDMSRTNICDFIQNKYDTEDATGKIDEYFEHHLCMYDIDNPYKYTIKRNDGVFFFNFRADRAKQLTKAILDKKQDYNLHFVSMARYGEDIDTDTAFSPAIIETTLGKELTSLGVKHAHISESEKFPHVTFFLNGQSDIIQEGETQIKIDSRTDIKTHDEAPEMKAKEIVDKAIESLKENDFIVVNFPNADMVGHTGNMEAVIKAVEAVDRENKRLVEYIESLNGVAFITADHGNAEIMIDDNDKQHVAHTTNLVPFVVVGLGDVSIRNEGTLADIAPTILGVFGIDKIDKMKGFNLLK